MKKKKLTQIAAALTFSVNGKLWNRGRRRSEEIEWDNLKNRDSRKSARKKQKARRNK